MSNYDKLKFMDPVAYQEALDTANGLIFNLKLHDDDHKRAAIIEEVIVNYTVYLLEKKNARML